MFDISFMELLIIAVIALIVIGPERLPTVSRTLGHLYGRCRNFIYSVKTDIHNEIRMEELKKMQSSVQDTIESVKDSVQQGINQLETTLTNDKNNENPSEHSSTTQSSSEVRQSLSNTYESPQARNREKEK
ncbi:MAG: twin-arginine translocase subunit TatB [Nitrosomonas sp. PRO4]|nr:twin-arginine translocase subunit TatB [Nitrosomonas sp. PRO4]